MQVYFSVFAVNAIACATDKLILLLADFVANLKYK